MEDSIKKFMSLDPAKRDRILNAAMGEFRYGYKKAATDTIVKSAGISKGLLFHYFGTKEKLYKFLVQYTIDLSAKDYYDMVNLAHKDILEGLWQLALLQKDIKDKHPYIFNFSDAVWKYRDDFPDKEWSDEFLQKQDDVYEELYKKSDITLIRDDIDPYKAFDLICGAISFFFLEQDEKGETDYDTFLEELRSRLDILRKCFYKTQILEDSNEI